MAYSIRLGLTGGIGSGKSTVATMLAECGACHIDADQIARALTAPGGAALPAIAQAFGAQVLDAQGALDRARMRALVFAQPQARARLEAIVHPLVGAESRRRTEQAMAEGVPLIVLDIPLLVESGRWPSELDQVAVVDCREATQIARVVQRSALAPEAVQAILAAQATRSARRAAADWVVYNDGLSLDDLRAQAGQIAAWFGL